MFTSAKKAKKSGYFSQPNPDLDRIIAESFSKVEVLRKIGVENPYGGGWYRILNTYIQFFKIDTSHFTGMLWSKGKKLGPSKQRIPNEEIFTNKRITTHVKQRYLELETTIKECAICKISDWQGKPLVLHLDHINGICSDNRLENLRLLCPNCHSQTHTYCRSGTAKLIPPNQCGICQKATFGKYCSKACYGMARQSVNGGVRLKTRKVDRPSKEILEQEIQTSSFLALGRKYGVSDNAIRKWCKWYGIHLEKRTYSKQN